MRGFGQLAGVDRQVLVVERSFAERLRETRGVAVADGQVVGAEQVVGDRQAHAVGEDVGLQVDTQIGHHGSRDLRRRNAVA